MELEFLETELSVCNVEDYSQVDLGAPLTFTGATDKELSLVCPTHRVPGNCMAREDGWLAFRVVGQLDFSLVGILSGITAVLADAGVGIFAVSTFDTDYVLFKGKDAELAERALRDAGYEVRHRGA